MQKEIKDFYDLDAWIKSHKFVLEVYNLTKDFPKDELYGLTSQLRRAAVSITANIAEGFNRYHFNDKARFYYNARGSVSEVQSFLFLAKDLVFQEETFALHGSLSTAATAQSRKQQPLCFATRRSTTFVWC